MLYGNVATKKKCESHVNNMTMFALSNTIFVEVCRDKKSDGKSHERSIRGA